MSMIELLIGPIASGKSTYTKMRANEGALILNDDSLVLGFHAGNYQLYNTENKKFYKSSTVVLALFAIMNGNDVVIDSTNLTKKIRGRWINMAQMLDIPVVGVTFKREDPAIHAGRRFAHDRRGYDFDYWLKVARHHDSLYQEPTEDEGFFNLVPPDVAREMAAEGMWSPSNYTKAA